MFDIPLPWPKRLYARALARTARALGQGHRYAPGHGDYDPSRVRFEDNPLTGDPGRHADMHDAIRTNPDAAVGGVTLGWLDSAFRSIAALDRLAGRSTLPCPVLVFTGAADRVVSNAAHAALTGRLDACTNIVIPDARHEILHETDRIRARFWREFEEFTASR